MSDNDQKHWLEAMQGVVPLKADNKINAKPAKVIPSKPVYIESESPPDIIFYDNDNEQPETIFFARTGLQYRVHHQLKTGQIRPQATLDLHGLTVNEARAVVAKFLTTALHQHLRSVKIIHGKGSAILRSKVYQWLPQCHQVLAFCSTIPSEGGTGAVYILLRSF